MRKLAPPTLLAAVVFLGAPGTARALDPEETGEMLAQIEDAEKQVKDRYGNRNPREMSQEEKKQYEKDMLAARDKVLEQHGVSLRNFEQSKLKMGREGFARSQEAKKGWAEKKKAAEEAKKKAAEANKEIKVQHGFDADDNVSEEHGVKVQRGRGKQGIEIPVPKEGEGEPPPANE